MCAIKYYSLKKKKYIINLCATIFFLEEKITFFNRNTNNSNMKSTVDTSYYK